jgi:general secretion pathway protein E
MKIADFLSKQGFEVTGTAKLSGQSGIEHSFNLIATLDDGFAHVSVAININAETNREAQLKDVFDFANSAYDVGIRQRTMINIFALDDEARQFAQKQGIRQIDAAKLESDLLSKPRIVPKNTQPLTFENKAQLLAALTERGYTFEEKARVRGRTGTEYLFDILADADYGLTCYSLAIEIFDGEVGLSQVSLFDTKSFDAGIERKAIAITGELTPDARQFTEYQKIRVIEPRTRASGKAGKNLPEPAGKKPEKDKLGDPIAKKETRSLKQSPQPEALQLIPEVMARRYNVIPVTVTEDTLQVVMANPTDIFALEALAAKSRKRIKPVGAAADEVRQAIDFNYKAYGEIEEQLSHVSVTNETADDKLFIKADAPLAQALNLIIEEAGKARASDIHIDPEENRLRIRYRIDGVLHDTLSLPLNIHRALISRIKILAEMNIADHYRPQDGQFTPSSKYRQLDIRVAITPTVQGEMAVLRLLDKSLPAKGLAELGMLPDSLELYRKIINNPYGMILVSGPTGSGKTTTMYATISSLDTISQNIITIEDPAEYRIKDINQIQVNTQAGITFASGLRSILRLDPNVIMVGEIRDQETSGIAVQAALTGHLVLSSIHANDSVSTLLRLLDLGVEAYLIASAVIAVVAQRMVRRVCPDCSHVIEAPVIEQIAYEKVMGEKLPRFRYGAGCVTCSNTGYLGRIGVFEILAINDRIRKLLADQADKETIHQQALKDGLIPMIKDGMLKVKSGLTTPKEVLRATYTQE